MNFNRTTLLLTILLCFATLTSYAQSLERVFVLNEGAFNNSNASVTSFIPSTSTVSQNVFFNANGRPLGDIANFSEMVNGKLYILVSNSNKLEIVHPQSLVSEAIIFLDDMGGSSPSQFVQVDDNRLYITNLTGNHVSIFNLTTRTVTGSVTVGNNPEGIAVSNGKAYVAVNGFGSDNKVVVIDIATDTVLKTLTVQDNPRQIVRDNGGKLWVLSTGNYGFDENFNYDPDLETFGEIHIIDPVTDTVTDIIEVGGHPSRMTFNRVERLAYVVNTGIQLVDMDQKIALPDLLSSTSYYSIAYWPGENAGLFAGFAPNFSSSGRVDILNTNGTVRSTFTAGIGPSYFQFIYDGPLTNIEHEDIAQRVTLDQNYPNPFNPSTQIRFTLNESTSVRLEVFSINGQRVATLANGVFSGGSHQVSFDGSGLSSGLYLYRLTTDQHMLTRKMMLVK